jgi:hypothetical protein
MASQNSEGYSEFAEQPPLPSIDLQKVFYQVNELLGLIQAPYPEVSLRLYLQASQVINNIQNNATLEELSYDFISTALIVYQDELSDSEEKMAAINLIVATISHLSHFDRDNYDTLSSNAAQYCHKLLKKPDQCQALTLCVHLFTNKGYVSPLSDPRNRMRTSTRSLRRT